MLLTPILLSTPDVGELEERYVLSAMRSGWVAPAGPDLDAFEAEVADRVGVPHAVGLASGTAAMHLALVSWGVGPGDVVPVSTFTFAATVNAIRYVGAEPFFVDADEETGNMSPTLLARALTQLREESASVPVVVPVDMLGKAVDYTAIAEVTREFGVRLLCDAAESLGATWQGRPAGSFGDATAISFNGNKIMTTSGGGMLLTADPKLAAHVRKLSTQAREPVAHYEHIEIGYNYRLSNILAALGRAQLTRLDAMIERRRGWRVRYKEIFAGQPGVRVLGGSDDRGDNCWLTAIVVDPLVSAWTVTELAEVLSEAQIHSRPVWKPMHLQPVSRDLRGVLDGTSERIFDTGLTLPSGSAMTDDQFERVAATIQEILV
ncbi:DegT/DnrJ/EryC1/StrS family aminotransferase [Ornithinimicrobium sp. LYQ103]|uniref:DegT/DnrJ/EryC1/StrS family aminotransferase n=1 Tax=Ornithinimicrobium sp. LYQ103 TaxID=3378796 RepID=UPI003853412F